MLFNSTERNQMRLNESDFKNQRQKQGNAIHKDKRGKEICANFNLNRLHLPSVCHDGHWCPSFSNSFLLVVLLSMFSTRLLRRISVRVQLPCIMNLFYYWVWNTYHFGVLIGLCSKLNLKLRKGISCICSSGSKHFPHSRKFRSDLYGKSNFNAFVF